MDYYGEIVDELTELVERIEFSPHKHDGRLVMRVLEVATLAAVLAERRRTASLRASPDGADQRIIGDLLILLKSDPELVSNAESDSIEPTSASLRSAA